MQDGNRSDHRHREDWLPQSVRDAGVQRVLDTGDFLFRADTRTAGLFEVVEGRIKLVRIAPSGRETILYAASAGDILAEASIFSPTYHCDAVAATHSVVRLYPKEPLFAAFRENPMAAQAFTGMLAREIMRLRTRLELRNIRSARDRLHAYLLLRREDDSSSVILREPLIQVAAEIGLAHETVYRTLAAMEADGEIVRRGTRIILT